VAGGPAPGARKLKEGTVAHQPGRNIGDDQNYRGLPEEDLRRAVEEHLEADETVDASEIEVEVEGEGVRLRGRVGSEVEREAAERVVTDIVGVEVLANELRVEPTARESDVVDEAERDDQVTGMGVDESDPGLGEAIGTEDPIEASDEGRSWTPPDAPQPEAMAATDPAHGLAEDQPRPTPGSRSRGRRPARVDEAVGRAMQETPEHGVRGAASGESAASFKEQMRSVADARDDGVERNR
jgi:hypothetical protein